MILAAASDFIANFCSYAGEGVVDDSVWMVKTHYPERMGYLKFKVRRIILLIRNPFDAMESYFHMGMTNTHDKHLSLQVPNTFSLTEFDTLPQMTKFECFNNQMTKLRRQHFSIMQWC